MFKRRVINAKNRKDGARTCFHLFYMLYPYMALGNLQGFRLYNHSQNLYLHKLGCFPLSHLPSMCLVNGKFSKLIFFIVYDRNYNCLFRIVRKDVLLVTVFFKSFTFCSQCPVHDILIFPLFIEEEIVQHSRLLRGNNIT